jgi:microcystin-dependent protein
VAQLQQSCSKVTFTVDCSLPFSFRPMPHNGGQCDRSVNWGCFMKRLFVTVAFATASHLACASLASAQVSPFVGEIRLFAFDFCPVGWLPANGQVLPITQDIALFALLGTTYGGDGKTTFALPNLAGRAPYGTDLGTPLGTAYAASDVTFTTGSPPRLAASDGTLLTTEKHHESIVPTGGGQSVTIQSPALALTWCIATLGVFPARN